MRVCLLVVSAAALAACGGENGSATAPPTPRPEIAATVQNRLSVGEHHSCAVTPNGEAYCWGNDYFGQLGAPPDVPEGQAPLDTPEPFPLPVSGGITFASISAGSFHTCALATGGNGYCWGSNDDGGLGTGASTERQQTPARVASALVLTAISTGNTHTCGLAVGGTAYCWGSNAFGELGIGSSDMTAHSTPQAVTGGHHFVTIDAGAEFTCALKADSTAFCWGGDYFGQVGDGMASGSCELFGASLDCRTVPSAVAGGRHFASLSVGGAEFQGHACGVASDKKVYCWGENSAGQLGTSTTETCAWGSDNIACSRAPVAVVGNNSFAVTTAGAIHSCALTTNGEAYCWGWNAYGQLGVGARDDNRHATPERVSGGNTFVGIATALSHTCAIRADGSAMCWGENEDGQLGNGSTTDSSIPAAVVTTKKFGTAGG